MSGRTFIAVVSELRKSHLTVEQQCLVDELVVIVAGLQSKAEVRQRWRENKRVQRQSEDKKKEPKKNNILNISQGGSRGDLSEDNFAAFWEAYPRKIAKGAAKKAYRNALTRASAEEILAGVKRYVASKPDPKFTAHPATWLNADRWLDEETGRQKVVNGFSGSQSWASKRSEYVAKYGPENAFKQYCADLHANPQSYRGG